MAVKFNPFSGQLQIDEKGSGGGSSYIDGEVATYNDLPLDGTAALNSAWLVREASGIWPVSRKQAGIYIRTATAGSSRDADYTYAGTMPDVFSDSVFLLYDEASTTRTGQFNLGSITAGQNRVLTWPDGNATIAATPVSRLQSFFTSQTYNVAEGINVDIELQNSAGSCAIVVVLPRLTTDGARNGDEILLRPTSLASGSSYTLQRYIWTGSSYTGSTENITTMEAGQTYRLRLVGGVWTLLVTPNLASPPAIGSTTRNTIAATTLNANNGTITASAPVLDLSQTWNNAAVTFTGLRFNVTNTASAAASNIADFQVGGTSIVSIGRDGLIGSANAGINVRSTGSLNRLSFFSQGATRLLHNNSILLNESDGGYGWVTSGAPSSLSFDTGIFRGGAGIIEQRNGTNVQASLVYGTYTSSTNYQRLAIRTKSVTVNTTSGASVVTTGGFIPDGAVLVGLTTRVSTAITGATGYDIGDGTDADRWGANIGVALNTSSDNTNWTATTIQCFTAAQEVTLTAVGSNFTGGAVVIVAHYLAGEAD